MLLIATLVLYQNLIVTRLGLTCLWWYGMSNLCQVCLASQQTLQHDLNYEIWFRKVKLYSKQIANAFFSRTHIAVFTASDYDAGFLMRSGVHTFFLLLFLVDQKSFLYIFSSAAPQRTAFSEVTIPDGSPSRKWQSTVGWGDCQIRTQDSRFSVWWRYQWATMYILT